LGNLIVWADTSGRGRGPIGERGLEWPANGKKDNTSDMENPDNP